MCLHRVKHFQVSSCLVCLWQMVGVWLEQDKCVFSIDTPQHFFVLACVSFACVAYSCKDCVSV
jgi:hypothetical protein